MTDEEEAKMKKMRMRIERDAYSVLLSFKDGASSNQVERRMDETLGYTYHSKYYQAGVYDMSQILREHPQVRTTADGKFKIIANEDNQDLVALIARQKDNKRKKGGAQKGRRPMTSIGHHRNSFGGGFLLRTSPKSAMRPLTALSRPPTQRPLSTVPHARQFNGNSQMRSSNVSKFGNAGNLSTRQAPNSSGFRASTVIKSPAASIQPYVQRPLVRPTTASSISTISVSQTSSSSTLTVSPPVKPIQSSKDMPSIKEFSDNTKRMMVNLYPNSVHLSEMTDRYSQEYDASVEPLQLFSKSWMMLVKTTFKEFLQIVKDGEVSLKEDWFRKYGHTWKNAAMVKSAKPVTTAASNSNSKMAPAVESNPSGLSMNSTLPVNQGFRYQPPKSPVVTQAVEAVRQKMKGLTVGPRKALLSTPEKPPGIITKPKNSAMVEGLFPINPSSEMAKQKANINDSNYDSKQLRNLKFVEKSGEVRNHVDAVLNEIPQLKRPSRKNSKVSPKSTQQTTPSKDINIPPVETTSFSNVTTTKAFNIVPLRSSLTQSDVNQPRTRSIQNTACSSRIFGRALADIHKQSDVLTTRRVETDTKPPTQLPGTSGCVVNSDDGWGVPTQVEKKIQQGKYVNQRKLLLPPMSKGSSLKAQNRSRPVSMSSQDVMNSTFELAINATLPDDDQW